MLAQKTYWIETKTSRAYESMDEEEHAALVSIMRSLASFCGINVLTYQIKSGNLSMLVSCPSREHHLEYFQDREDEPAGSGIQRLFKHLRKLYTQSHIDALAAEYESLLRHNEDTQEFWERCTRRIGTPRKFAEGINEAFARWIKKNRPQLYESLEGKVCRKDISQTYVEQLLKQRDVAFNMDEDAILHDDGSESRKYWCGYADALRGDEDALDGLREIMRSVASSTEEIKDLGYGNQRAYYSTKRESRISPARQKSSRSGARRGRKKPSHDTDLLAEHIAPEVSAPPKPMSHSSKLKLMSVAVFLLIIICGVGAIIAFNEWRQYQASKGALELAEPELTREDISEKESSSEKAEPENTAANLEKDKRAQIKAQLYEPEARQLANDFGMSTNPQVRLSMCRNLDQIKKRLDRYSENILSEAATNVEFKDVVDLGGIMAARFVAIFPDKKSRLICVVSTDDGLRVDLDCYARYNNLAIPELLSGDTKSAELRIFVERSNYYNFSFKDDVNWSSFALKSPDSDEIIYAYCRKAATTGKLLDAATSRLAPGGRLQLTLQISSSEDSHKRKQFTIDRVYAFGWVRAKKDIEDVYRSKLKSIVNE